MDMRSQIDEKYAKELEAFSMTQRKAFEKIYENSHTKNAINEMILEANCTAQIHREARKSFRLLHTAIFTPKVYGRFNDKGFYGTIPDWSRTVPDRQGSAAHEILKIIESPLLETIPVNRFSR